MSGGVLTDIAHRLTAAARAWGSVLERVAHAVAYAVATAHCMDMATNKALRQAASLEDARLKAVKQRRRAKALARSRRNVETLKKEGRCR